MERRNIFEIILDLLLIIITFYNVKKKNLWILDFFSSFLLSLSLSLVKSGKKRSHTPPDGHRTQSLDWDGWKMDGDDD
jgi:hypothetical protein